MLFSLLEHPVVYSLPIDQPRSSTGCRAWTCEVRDARLIGNKSEKKLVANYSNPWLKLATWQRPIIT